MAIKSKIKLGDRFKLNTTAYGQYGYSIGDVVVITYANNAGNVNVQDVNYNLQQISISRSHIDAILYNKETVKQEINELKAKIKEKETKLEFMEEMGVDEYDEDEVKVYTALKALGSKSSLIEKTKTIAKLLK